MIPGMLPGCFLAPFGSHFPSKINEKIDAKIDAEKVMKFLKNQFENYVFFGLKFFEKSVVCEKCLMQINL